MLHKKMFWNTLQNSEENIYVGVPFLKKLQVFNMQPY